MTPTRTINLLKGVRIVPRWMIFLLDLLCSQVSLFIAILLRNNLLFESLNFKTLFGSAFLLGIVNVFVFTTVRTYRGIVRYTGIQDAVRVLFSVLISSILIYIFQFFFESGNYFISRIVLILYTVFSFLFLLGYRVLVKFGFEYIRNYRLSKKRVIIFGAGEAGVATKRVLMHDQRVGFHVMGFIDDDFRKANKLIDGVTVETFQQFKDGVKGGLEIDELILACFTLSSEKKNEIVDFCLDHEINVLSVPPYSQWADGNFSSKQLKSIKIEELLGRAPIVIQNEEIKKQVKGKRVLVTGAAGSIGSEIVRQLLTYHPELIVLCDQAETPLHDLEMELKESTTYTQYIPFLTNVNHLPRMEDLFKKYKPHYVYHAAAYKHVPMMEFNPVEAVKVNVLGTQQVADLSIKYGVERFVMVSTDKAVNPTNVMGASKRLAEMYVQGLSIQNHHNTKFITTRFGNVLGSNGSVILRFKDQIEKGGPVTVTHPNITRYFMTIPEACQLVLEAGVMGNGGEVFVFDMGEPVKIGDLAKKMIRLYGYIPNIDINITYSGLRPGEKLYEELLNDGENTIKTYHEKIMIAKVRDVEFGHIKKCFDNLAELIEISSDEARIVHKMKEFVPEYISKNSVFENLDSGTKIVKLN